MHDSPNLNNVSTYGINKTVTKTFSAGSATLQMADHERVCFASGATIAGTVYLPPVALCAGEIVYIEATSVATGNVTVKPWETAGNLPECTIMNESGAQTSQALASAYAYTVLFSNGKRWFAISFDLSI